VVLGLHQPVHGEFTFQQQAAVQTIRDDDFAERTFQVRPAAVLSDRLSRQAICRPALGPRADGYETNKECLYAARLD
jgi:hypothetical protein